MLAKRETCHPMVYIQLVQFYAQSMILFAHQCSTAICPAAILPVEVVLVHVGEAQRRVCQLLNHSLGVFGVQHLI